MLEKLTIQNYAIIDKIDITFSSNLNIITGETGAGKSIILGAIGLVLGDRADATHFHNNAEKCIVESLFNIKKYKSIQNYLKSNDLDGEEHLVIRREITPQGKSRSFVNDTPVSLQALKEIAVLLVDLHQQFDTADLHTTTFQRNLLDGFVPDFTELKKFQLVFAEFELKNKELRELMEQKNKSESETGYNQFLLAELNQADFKPNEIEDIEQVLKRLNRSEQIKELSSVIEQELKHGDSPMVPKLKKIAQRLLPFQDLDEKLINEVHRLQSISLELEDTTDTIQVILNRLQEGEGDVLALTERIDEGNRLLKKHKVTQTNDLLAIQKKLASQLTQTDQLHETIDLLKSSLVQLEKEALDIAKIISHKRKQILVNIEDKVNKLLQLVGMPNARFKVSIEPIPLSRYGIDEISFLIDANKSGVFHPIKKVASGGELSRIMLILKTLMAQQIDMPTQIFDEIDSGTSGEVAKQISILLQDLAHNRQIICITHQPQIASKADIHFFVYKDMESKGIKTHIKVLSQEERIQTIAQMLGGVSPSQATVQTAREMVKH
ncbi:MAG: DNA repair protein RecN [Phycisphaerales bacterium]|nr:DNA repair protein RecN [Phycisphaerales bacterium]